MNLIGSIKEKVANSRIKSALEDTLAIVPESLKDEVILLKAQEAINESSIEKKIILYETYLAESLKIGKSLLAVLTKVGENDDGRSTALQDQSIFEVMKHQEMFIKYAKQEGEENVRTQIASDLHDMVGGDLLALKLLMESSIASGDIKEVEGEKMIDILNRIQNSIRTISHSIHEAVDYSEGLIALLGNRIERLSAGGSLDISFLHSGLEKKTLPRLTVSHIFGIISELISNTVKHAKASKLSIQLIKNRNSLVLLIDDDGVGFEPGKISKGRGIGLKNIENRVFRLDGSLSIESAPQKGATIIIKIPLH